MHEPSVETVTPVSGFAALKAKWDQGASKFGSLALPSERLSNVQGQVQHRQASIAVSTYSRSNDDDVKATCINDNDLGSSTCHENSSVNKNSIQRRASMFNSNLAVKSLSYHVPSPTKSKRTVTPTFNSERYNVKNLGSRQKSDQRTTGNQAVIPIDNLDLSAHKIKGSSTIGDMYIKSCSIQDKSIDNSENSDDGTDSTSLTKRMDSDSIVDKEEPKTVQEASKPKRLIKSTQMQTKSFDSGDDNTICSSFTEKKQSILEMVKDIPNTPKIKRLGRRASIGDCSPHTQFKRSSSTDRHTNKKSDKSRVRSKNKDFDGNASCSSCDLTNICDLAEELEVRNEEIKETTPTSIGDKPGKNEMNQQRMNQSFESPTTKTNTPMVTRPILRKKMSGPRNSNDGGNYKKQAVIYTRQVQTITDLPVFEHTDYEDDMILQALYNKEELFSQLRVGQLKQLVSAFEKYIAPAGDIIIFQGDHVNQSSSNAHEEKSYFYVIHRGIVEFTIDDQHIGTAGVGESFGEYALLYNTLRSATVLALEDVELFRVDSLSFRRILSSQTQKCTHMKCRLLESIHFLESIVDEYNLPDNVVLQAFRQGDVLHQAGDDFEKLYIVGEGVVHRKTKSSGRVDTLALRQGDYFGEQSLVSKSTSASTFTAASNGIAFTLDRSLFNQLVIGKVNSSTATLITNAIMNDQMIRRLAVLQFMIQYTEPLHVVNLAPLLRDKSFSAGETILVEKETVRAALYYVKQGQVTLSAPESVAKVLPIGAWFGELHMFKAYARGKKTTKCAYTVTARADCICSVLSMKDFLSIVAPHTQSSHNLCPEVVQTVAPLEQIEEATESGVEPAVIVPTSLECTSDHLSTPVIFDATKVVEEILVSSNHEQKQEMENTKYSNKHQRQPSDSSVATTASNTIISPTKADVLNMKPLLPPIPIEATDCTQGPQSKERRKLPVKRQRQLSFVKVAPLTVKLQQLQKHTILGEGTFGIVWLVSDPTNKSETKHYALKKQSKAFLIGENQVESVIQEKIMLENMRHPFLIQLEKTYQDECFIYMLLEFVQGGELFSLMHEDESSILPEHQAKFYALCLADVLDYLRNRKYVYRDLKGENVMLDAKGYVKLIDFGFCKYLLADKTYTLCGTPGYLSPEMVTCVGHDFSTDHWSLGVLIYEMISGTSPFYYDGIDQGELFDSIARNDFPPLASSISKEAKDLVAGLLRKDPMERYGSKNQGKIYDHTWFNELDIDSMRHRETQAPWVPLLDGPLDTSNFNDWSELEQADNDGTDRGDGDVSKKGLAVSKRDQKLFEGVF